MNRGWYLLPTTRAINALIGDEEKNEKYKKKEKERNRELDTTPVTLDHLATSYNPQGSYGESIAS